MENEKLFITASAISVSEQQSLQKSDVFMLVKFRLIDSAPNLNRQGVTSVFIDDMMSRKDQLIGLPLYCDVERLLMHDYEHLGHMLDEEGVFHSTQIGSLTAFEKVNEGGVSAIITTAKIPKREMQICMCLEELFNNDALKFSFQISYNPDAVVEQDGIVYVDGNPDNSLTGVAVVSVPANPNSYAMQLVAQKFAEATEGVETMNKEEMEKAIAEAVAAKESEMANAIAEKDAVIAEKDAKIAELNNAIAENPFADKKEDGEEEEATAECKTEEAECKKAEAECNKEDTVASVDEQNDEACAECDPEKDDMKAEIGRLKAELDSMNQMKAEYETMKAEKAAKELAENQAKAKAFAEKQGLDIVDENVAKAIAEVDYKMIAELCMKADESPKQEKVAVASVVCDGFEIKGGKWDDLLAPSK